MSVMSIMGRVSGRVSTVVGLDIGSYWLKAIEFGSTRTGREIRGLARMELPPEMRHGGREPGAMARLVKDCLAEGGISARDVVIMISGPQIFIRRITMPPMPQEDLAEVIPFEAAKHVSFPAEKLKVDYVVVGEKKVNDIKNLDILLVAIPTDVLEKEISVVRAAGLRPVAVTVAPMVMWKTFQLGNQDAEGKVIAMLDIGFERTTISLLNNGMLEFTRAVNLGGDEVTRSMTVPFVRGGEGLHTLTYDEAEAIKKEYGLPSPAETGMTKDGIPFNQISMLMNPAMEKLLGEVRASFDFYMSEFEIPRVDKIIMSGGGAALKGLREFLAGDLGVEAVPADPFRGVNFAEGISKDDFMDSAPAFVMPLGLAAWESGDLNLLVQRKARESLGRIRSLVIPGVAAAAVIIIFILYWTVSSKLAETREELDQKTGEIASLSPISAATLMLGSKKRKLEAEVNSMPQALKESIDPARILEEIRISTPDNTRLEQILVIPQTGKKLIQIWGTAFFLDERGTAMSDFMAALEDSPLFDDVRMLSVEEDKNYTVNGLRFLVSCNYSAVALRYR